MHTERILFIDDDAPVRMAFQRSLRREGFQVDLADGVEEALKLAENDSYAVIATDYRMPHMHGLDAIEKLRTVQPNATYVLISGECDLDLALEAVNAHAVSYVVCKPWNTGELASVLRRSMEQFWERAGYQRIVDSMVDMTRKLESKKQELSESTESIERQIADVLLRALDLRCKGAFARGQHMAAEAKRLAVGVGLTGRAVQIIEHGALLHEIGKLGLSDATAQAAQSMLDFDLAACPAFIEATNQLLSSIETLHPARDVIMQQFENWDGSGAPNQSSGEEITVGARMLKVVVAMQDALGSGQDLDQASATVRGLGGQSLDPFIADIYSRMLRDAKARSDAAESQSAAPRKD